MDPPRRPGAAGGTVKPWPGGSRGLPGPRPPRHLEWLPAAAAAAGAVAAAGGRSVVPTSQTTPTIEARCVPATCVQLAYRGGGGFRRGIFPRGKFRISIWSGISPSFFKGRCGIFPVRNFVHVSNRTTVCLVLRRSLPFVLFPLFCRCCQPTGKGGAGSRIICEWWATPSTEVISRTMVIAFSHDL